MASNLHSKVVHKFKVKDELHHFMAIDAINIYLHTYTIYGTDGASKIGGQSLQQHYTIQTSAVCHIHRSVSCFSHDDQKMPLDVLLLK